ncbi:MAG: CpaD family pilus assembly protein [Sphingomonas sp.]
MRKSPRLLILAAPALLVAGCTGTQNRGMESVHQPVVSLSNYAFDLNTDARGLAPGETQRLDAWLASLRLGYGDRVAIDTGGAPDTAARIDIAREVGRYGLLLTDAAPVTASPITPGTVRVVLTRTSASVPGCPDHSRIASPDNDNNVDSNFGCATNSNIAAMVANPEDLIHGRSATDVADPAVSSKAIETFRKAPNTGAGELKQQSTTQGASGG